MPHFKVSLLIILTKFLYFCINLIFLLEISLTDEESRKNWEEFGNPDGPQGNNYEWLKSCIFCALRYEMSGHLRSSQILFYVKYFFFDLKISNNSLHVKLAVVCGWEKWKVRKEFAFKFLIFLSKGKKALLLMNQLQ